MSIFRTLKQHGHDPIRAIISAPHFPAVVYTISPLDNCHHCLNQKRLVVLKGKTNGNT